MNKTDNEENKNDEIVIWALFGHNFFLFISGSMTTFVGLYVCVLVAIYICC